MFSIGKSKNDDKVADLWISYESYRKPSTLFTTVNGQVCHSEVSTNTCFILFRQKSLLLNP